MPHTLRQLLDRGPIEPSTVVDILQELLETLAFDHWRGVVHGDITPETIVLSSRSRPWFGGSRPSYTSTLAGPEAESDDYAGGGAARPMPGTSVDPAVVAAYTSPEQLAGSPADERSDIFAIAVVAYEMFTGRHPFGASDGLPAASVAHRIMNEPPLSIAAPTLAGLSRPVLQVLDVAFSKDPNRRYDEALRFLEVLKDAAARPAGGATPPATTPAPVATPPVAPVEPAEPSATFEPRAPFEPAAPPAYAPPAPPAAAPPMSEAPAPRVPVYIPVPDEPPTPAAPTPQTEEPAAPRVATAEPPASPPAPEAPAPPAEDDWQEPEEWSEREAWRQPEDQQQPHPRPAEYWRVPEEDPASFDELDRKRLPRWMWMAGSAIVLIAIIAAAVWFFLLRDDGSGSASTTTASTTVSAVVTSTSTTEPATTTTSATTTTTEPPTTTTEAPTTSTSDATTATTAALVRFEQTEKALDYAGEWTTVAKSAASGGDFAYTAARGSSVTITFDGTYLAWIAKRSPAYGKAEVTLDGKKLGMVDLYAKTEGWQLKVWGSGNLKPGRHTVIIAWTGKKNPAADDANIGIDAFDVRGTLVDAAE